MEMDFFDEIGVKKQRNRIKPNHRWTESETQRLLQGIANLLKMEKNAEFERPSARIFYEKLREKYFTEEGDFSVIILKGKMRHLRYAYVRAKEWKENVGTELYASDQKYVNAKIKKMCPFYNLLEEIFGASLNSDPIGFHVQDDDVDEKTSDYFKKSNKKLFDGGHESLEGLVTPKVETTYNESYTDNEHEREDGNDDVDDDDDETTFDISNNNYTNFEKKHNSRSLKNQSSSSMDMEERRYQLDKQKFQIYHEFEGRRLNLEERKFKYEKEKFEKMQELRKYEINKQFEMKKFEIETNQRLKLLELGKTINDFNQVMIEMDNEKKISNNNNNNNFEVEVMIDELETEDAVM